MPPPRQIEFWVAESVAAAGAALEAAEISVRLVGKAEMRELNRAYRNKNRPTNVLSFPAGEMAGVPAEAARTLGDIVVCAPVVNDEAALQGKAAQDHWAHMLIHGTLHLLGYDHESATEAAAMEGLETRILSAHGIADPYLSQ